MKFTNVDHKPWPSVAWSIIEQCNLKCPYCAAGMQNAQSRDKASLFDIKYVANVVSQYNNKMEFELLGGEPTLHPLINYILETLSALENVVEVGILTNALAYKRLKPDKTFILATYHPYKGYINRYIDNIMHYIDDGHRVTCTMTVEDEYAKDFTRLWEFCRNNNIQFEPTYVTTAGSTRLPSISSGPKLFELDGRRYSLHEVLSLGLNKFKGWTCSQRLFSMDCHGMLSTRCKGKLGRISAARLVPVPIVCNNDTCVLDEQIEEEKYRP